MVNNMDFSKSVSGIIDQARRLDGRPPRRNDGKPEGTFLWKRVNDERAELRIKRSSRGISREYRDHAARASVDHAEAHEADLRGVESNLEGFASSGSMGIRPGFHIVDGMIRRQPIEADPLRAGVTPLSRFDEATSRAWHEARMRVGRAKLDNEQREAAAKAELDARLAHAARRRERNAFWAAYRQAW
jgi:hypothetical protein